MTQLTARASKRKAGFTLIELMIVVAIIGIIAMLAVPAYITFIRRSKTAEAGRNLRNIFDAAATYYSGEHYATMGLAAAGTNDLVACAVAGGATANAVAGAAGQNKFQLEAADYGGGLGPTGLGIAFDAPVYYQYTVVTTGTAGCSNTPSMDIYTLRAQGNLDGDGDLSTFELYAGSDADNNLYRSPGLWIDMELE